MWSFRLFWKLFLSYAALNLAATVTFVVIVSGWQEDQVVEQIKQRLTDSAILIQANLGDLMSEGRTERLQARVARLGRELDTRITLVSMQGEVLADSQQAGVAEVDAMENHKDRVELVQAATHGRGWSERTSPTLGSPMLYVALRVDRDGESAGLVRTAFSMTKVRAEVAAIDRLIWFVAGLVSLAVVGLTYFVSARVARPIGKLTEVAEAIAAGNYQHRVYPQTQDELGLLAKSFNRMSDRLEAREAELRESSQRLATVMEGMAEGVIAVDDRERVVLANAAAGRLLGFEPVAATGKPLLEVVRSHVMHEALSDVQGNRWLEIELGDDGNRVLGVNMTLLEGEPSTSCILVLQDVTELRRLESLRQEFVANVSHELKTPLSAIKAYAETLLGGALHDENNNRRFVLRIEEQAERLHQLILDLLSLARIESGKQAFDIAAIGLAELVESCLAAHQAAAEAKGICLTAGGDPRDVQVRADEEGMQEILNNLIDNAIKYTHDGGRVAITWRLDDAMVVIEVRDTGIGIAPAHLPRVFERFYRVDKARSRELGGTGLGLAIVKHLAQSFGGGVQAQANEPQGTVFTVRLPHPDAIFTES